MKNDLPAGGQRKGCLLYTSLDLSDYADKEEFYEACRELHKDEEDAEYMFQDWENVPEGLIDESWISENFFALRDAVEDLSDTEQEMCIRDSRMRLRSLQLFIIIFILVR